jgi:ferredoxin
MKVKLDPDVCDAHGDCVVAAPEIFDLDDDDEVAKVLIPEPDEDMREKAVEAADACPVQAITIED